MYSCIRTKVQARSHRFYNTKSSSKRVSNNQAWIGNGGQISRSTMENIQGCSQEANHKNQKLENQKNKEQSRIVVGQKSRRTRNSA